MTYCPHCNCVCDTSGKCYNHCQEHLDEQRAKTQETSSCNILESLQRIEKLLEQLLTK